MLSEAKKREKFANAVLGAALAASAAQSPKDFVKTGHVESPGTALMQMWGKKRSEAERNLDHGRVSHSARNRKKTFEEFMMEAKAPKPDALETIQRNTKRATPGMKYVVHTTSSDDIRVDNIEVPENQRGKGIATRRLKGLHKYADKIGKNVSLTPVAKPGYKEKLDKMYRNLGYRDRKPSDKIAGADTMIRTPQKEK